LGTAEDAGGFGLLYEGVSGRERISRQVQFAGPHLRVPAIKYYRNMTIPDIEQVPREKKPFILP
jgi:hypothetical protein